MRFFVLCAAAALLAMAGCGTSQTSPGSSDSIVVLATVGDVEITNVTIRNELELIPPYQRASFETPEGQRTLLDHLVERELLLQAAEDAGLEEDSTVQAQVQQAMLQVEYARQRALITAFYEQKVVTAVTIPDSTILAYYNEHTSDIYFQPAQVMASMILTAAQQKMDEASAALAAGAPFDSTAMGFSEHAATAPQGGDLGWVTADSPMPYLGSQPDIATALFAAAAGDLVGPFTTDLGVVLFKVTDKTEAGPRAFEDVRESIINILRPAEVNNYFRNSVIPGLREQYGVEINEDAFLPGLDVPADSLMEIAQSMMEASPERAIRYFQLYLERFPGDPKAYQAQFLIGFTYSEYLRDFESARQAFSNMVTRFPDSELTDDAQWMIDNMETPIDSLIPTDSTTAAPGGSL
jgi:peptidyl-prolyl cis-trans isomerase C